MIRVLHPATEGRSAVCYDPGIVASDIELLDRWRDGDAEAGEQLFERHFDAVVRFFRNKIDDGADDLVQHTFLGCLRGKDRFRGDASFRSYLFVTAHNVLKNHFRGRARPGVAVDFSVNSVSDFAPSPSSVMARRREHQLLLEALRRIPLNLQVALELQYWEGLSASDIGEVLDLPAGTVKTRIRRAKQLVAEHMKRSAQRGLQATEEDLLQWARSVRAELLAD